VFQVKDLVRRGRQGSAEGIVRSRRTTARGGPHLEAVVLTSRTMGSPELPFFTVFGMHIAVATVIIGGTLVMQPRLDVATALAPIERGRLTVAHDAPPRSSSG
jgi:hypothetical protein